MTSYYTDAALTLYHGEVLDVLRQLPDESVQMCVTSPPYWQQRDYGVAGQLGMEATPQEYVLKMVAVFREIRRLLTKHGVCFLNLGDSYASGGRGVGGSFAADGLHCGTGKLLPRLTAPPGLKPKDLVGIPWRAAFALQEDGWWLRSEITWCKTAPMPESVKDRPTSATEKVFLLTKSATYYYDADAVKVPAAKGLARSTFTNGKTGTNGRGRVSRLPCDESDTRNLWNYWLVNPEPLADAHYAAYPTKLIEPCILAGSREGDVVLDPFVGSGTTCLVSQRLGRKSIGIDISSDYLDLAIKRCQQKTLWFQEAAS